MLDIKFGNFINRLDPDKITQFLCEFWKKNR